MIHANATVYKISTILYRVRRGKEVYGKAVAHRGRVIYTMVAYP